MSEALTFDGFRHCPYLGDQKVFTRKLGYSELIVDKRQDPKD